MTTRKNQVHPAADASKQPYERYPVGALLLDPENPRLVEYGLPPGASQNDILKLLWERMAVEEIAMSIAYNGFFPHEPLFIEKQPNGDLVVIEGNRRFAAVQLLLDANKRKLVGASRLPDIDKIEKTKS